MDYMRILIGERVYKNIKELQDEKNHHLVPDKTHYYRNAILRIYTVEDLLGPRGAVVTKTVADHLMKCDAQNDR